MRLKSIKLKNFFSFGSAEVDFDKYGNLVLVRGENAGEDSSNGAGKSSLFESVYWCLTGKTVRGVLAKDVVKFGEDQVLVRVGFTHKGSEVVVERTWSQAKKSLWLEIDGKVEFFHDMKQGTNLIFEFLGISPDILSLTGFYGRNFSTFSNYTPKERAEIIDILADGEKWERARVAAQAMLKEYKAVGEDSCLKNLDRFEDEKKVKVSRIVKLEIELENMKNSQSDRIAKIEEERDDKESEYAKKEDEIRELEKSSILEKNALKIKELEEERDMLVEEFRQSQNEKASKLSEEKDKVAEFLQEVSEERLKIGAECASIEDKIKATKKRRGKDVCESCGQKLPQPPNKEELDKEIADLEQKLEESKKEYNKFLDCEKEEKMKSEELGIELRDLLSTEKTNIQVNKLLADNGFAEKIETLLGEIKKEEEQEKELLKEARELSRQLEVLENQIQKEKISEDILKHETLIGVLEVEMDGLLKTIECETKALENVRLIMKKCAFWAQGFKDLRYSEFKNTTKVLEQMLNGFCSQQGLEFDKVEVSSWKSNSRGDQVPEVNIYVRRGDTRMSLDSLSEGEMQRVDLACFFTFSLLIEKSIGFKTEFCILDEPLNGLDHPGKKNVFDIVSTLSKDRQIFTIDHDSNFQDAFSSVMTVEKHNRNSYIK